MEKQVYPQHEGTSTRLDVIFTNTQTLRRLIDSHAGQGIIRPGLWRRPKDTVFWGLRLNRQLPARAVNTYRIGDSYAVCKSFRVIGNLESTAPFFILGGSGTEAVEVDDTGGMDGLVFPPFSVMRIPGYFDQYFSIQERYLDIVAAGVLAVHHHLDVGKIRPPYELEEVTPQIARPDGERIRIFGSTALGPETFAIVGSGAYENQLDMLARCTTGDLTEVKNWYTANPVINPDVPREQYDSRLIAQSVSGPLTATERSTMEELLAATVAVAMIPNKPVQGEHLF